jgi:hypothetical protein
MADPPPPPTATGAAGADLRLVAGLYLRPTPLGAFRASTTRQPGPEVRFVRRLLREHRSPPLRPEVVARLAGGPGAGGAGPALALLSRLQDRAWVEGHERPAETETGALEDGLPRLLPPLSSRGRALLADRQGFCLASVGFDPDVATALSAFSADIAATTERHAHRLDRVTGPAGPDTGAVGLVDGFGNSELGFWPLFVGPQRFILAVAGLPRLNRPELVDLVARLSIRYGGDEPPEQ